MKNTIGKKILLRIIVPSLIIISGLSVFMAVTSTQYLRNRKRLEMKAIAEINAVELSGMVDSVVISVKTAADLLEKIDGITEHNARAQADDVLKSMLSNGAIYNVWFVFEPNAFDGRDQEFTQDYPGAPSGRFFRSYVMEDGEITMAPDMSEDDIDDPALSPWYTIPRDEKRLVSDMDVLENYGWDYGVGQDAVFAVGIIAPIFRGQSVIGCVGADIIIENLTEGLDQSTHANVAVFNSDGYILYAPGIEYSHENLKTLGFNHDVFIQSAFANNEALYLPKEYCPFTEKQSFTYFQPIPTRSYNGKSLFVYVAMHRTVLRQALVPMYGMIFAVTVSVIIALLILFNYVIRSISQPINRLTAAADAISQGNIEIEIGSYTNDSDEISSLSNSLHKMVEQFRIYILDLSQTQERADIYMLFNELVRDTHSLNEVGISFCHTFRNAFKAHKSTVISLEEGHAAAYTDSDKESRKFTFTYHEQIENLMTDRKLAYINSHTIRSKEIKFLDADSVSACVLPVKIEEQRLGYIIYESQDTATTMTHSDEPLMVYLAELLADWLSTRKKRTYLSLEPLTLQEPTNNLLEGIEGLDTAAAIQAMGGLRDVYERSVRLTARLLPETIQKLDNYVKENDMKNFKIEVHALKSVLRNIGAAALGEQAAILESDSAKGKPVIETWPYFKEKVRLLNEQLILTLPEKETAAPKKGIDNDFVFAVSSLREAAEDYDSVRALEIIKRIKAFSYNEKIDASLTDIEKALEGFDCEIALALLTDMEGAML